MIEMLISDIYFRFKKKKRCKKCEICRQILSLIKREINWKSVKSDKKNNWNILFIVQYAG